MKYYRILFYVFTVFVLVTPSHGNDKSYYKLSAVQQPTTGISESIGSYANGCLAGGVKLPQNGDGFQLMRLSRKRYYVHRDLYNFIINFAKQVKQSHRFGGIVIGDTGGAIGGPMPSGHASHQIGLDVDIWLRPAYPETLSNNDRETLSAISHVTKQQTMRDTWNQDYTNFVLMAAKNPKTARIFVNPAIKRRICEHTNWQTDLKALAKIRPWYGHDAHMHIRLKCPKDSTECIEQPPPINQHGCTGNDINWWFSDEALHPKPNKTPKYQKTFSYLPQKCQKLYKKTQKIKAEIRNTNT